MSRRKRDIKAEYERARSAARCGNWGPMRCIADRCGVDVRHLLADEFVAGSGVGRLLWVAGLARRQVRWDNKRWPTGRYPTPARAAHAAALRQMRANGPVRLP